MRSGHFAQYTLADLTWLVAAPLTAGTFAIINAQDTETGATMPAAVALWATVSPAVDRRLTAAIAEPIAGRWHCLFNPADGAAGWVLHRPDFTLG